MAPGIYLYFIISLISLQACLLTNSTVHSTYIVYESKVNLHSQSCRCQKGSLFYLFLKLVQTNFVFSDNIHILHIYRT